MTTTKLVLAATAALTAGLTLAGCATTTSAPPATTAAPSSSVSVHNDQDVSFAQMMLPHHQQAIQMSETLLAKGAAVNGSVRALAAAIVAEQRPQITTLTGWLEQWGQPTGMLSMSPSPTMSASAAPSSSERAMSGMGGMPGMSASPATSVMPGLMSDADMQALQHAAPAAAGKLFLQQMIQHHAGAVTMATAETAHGANPAAIRMAKSIAASQATEITRMKSLLAAL